MVSPWHRPYATLISDDGDVSFVIACNHNTWLDGLFDLVSLTLIQEDLLGDNFDQVIGR